MPNSYERIENVLRYEYRVTSHVARRFKRDSVTASTLTDRAFFYELAKNWHGYYRKIGKKSCFTADNKDRKVKSAFEYICGCALGQMGVSKVDELVNKMKNAGVFDSRRQDVTRLKNKLREVINLSGKHESDELIKELSTRVAQSIAYV